MRRKNISFAIISALFVLVILFCTTQTVMSQEKMGGRGEKQYYAQMEKEYYSNIKQLLDEKGYSNSGITIRWISDEEGMRTYAVMIHHKRIDMLENWEKEELLRELAKTEFIDKKCTFSYEFLTT